MALCVASIGISFWCVVGEPATSAPASAPHSKAPAPAGPSAASIAACASCHGPGGEGNAAGTPRLSGLPADYLDRQLEAMATGARKGAPMNAIAAALPASQRRALADYYAGLAAAQSGAPPSESTTHSGMPALPEVLGPGQQLARRGRWADGIPACESCHGRDGVGVGSAFPPLAGQSAAYLENELRAWQHGTRPPGPLGLMRAVAKRLTSLDIRQVAAYYATVAQTTSTGSSSAMATKPAEPAQADSKSHTAATAPRSTAPFSPASRPIPADDFGRVIRLGQAIFDDPSAYAGRYVGNALTCTNCHLDSGLRVGSAPMWAAYVAYPAYRAKNHHVNTFAERLQGCFRFSMNGVPPPLGDPVLVALESYAYWMALGAPLDPALPGRGYTKLAAPARAPDYRRGEIVYAGECALCHTESGAGQSDRSGHAVFPALWGADSFNWGAGMGNVDNAAAFVHANMPLALGGTLSEQEAWDVAYFMDGHERPQDPRFTDSVEETRRQFHADAWSLYGQRVSARLLGAQSPPPGPRRDSLPAR